MILKTRRLLLRPMAQDDAPALFAILGDSQAMRFWDRPPLTRLAVAEEMVREHLAAMADGLCRYWTVLLDGAAIGSCDLSLIEPANRSAQTGFLFRRDHWGHGYASEAVDAMAAHGLDANGPDALGLARLEARIHAGNVRARRVLARSGFTLERTLPAYALPSGARADCELHVRRRPSRMANGT